MNKWSNIQTRMEINCYIRVFLKKLKINFLLEEIVLEK